MADATHPPAKLGDRWNGDVVLKRDVFSTIVRGRGLTAEGETPILRRLDQIPWWTAPLARHLFARAARPRPCRPSGDFAPPPLRRRCSEQRP